MAQKWQSQWTDNKSFDFSASIREGIVKTLIQNSGFRLFTPLDVNKYLAVSIPAFLSRLYASIYSSPRIRTKHNMCRDPRKKCDSGEKKWEEQDGRCDGRRDVLCVPLSTATWPTSISADWLAGAIKPCWTRAFRTIHAKYEHFDQPLKLLSATF